MSQPTTDRPQIATDIAIWLIESLGVVPADHVGRNLPITPNTSPSELDKTPVVDGWIVIYDLNEDPFAWPRNSVDFTAECFVAAPGNSTKLYWNRAEELQKRLLLALSRLPFRRARLDVPGRGVIYATSIRATGGQANVIGDPSGYARSDLSITFKWRQVDVQE